MGLETVELLMAIETEFGIQISDADAEELQILGSMHAYILRALRAQGRNPDPDVVWEHLKKIVVYQLGVRPELVTPDTDIVMDLGAH